MKTKKLKYLKNLSATNYKHDALKLSYYNSTDVVYTKLS